MNLAALPAFTDNYIWMLHDGSKAVVVDPGDAAPVHAALDALRLQLVAILVTHHHADHVGGVDALRSRLIGPVHGPAGEAIPRPFEPHHGGDVLQALGLRFEVIDVPGHTSGHIAYVTHDDGQTPLLFCGDTLFSAGCGRLFEGTPAQMVHSLSLLNALDASTRVCCTHEYTLANLKFAAAVEPGNAAVRAHLARCAELRSRGEITLPSTLERERAINPFLRCSEPGVVDAAIVQGAADRSAVNVFAALREWKNHYR
jgi:hydroxyacylglutathione hydrolase